jgi:hypothetical protein
MLRGLWFAWLLAVAACGDADVGAVGNGPSVIRENASANVAASRAGRPADTSPICIYTVVNSVEALDVFEFTRSKGGRTCYRESRRTIFVPSSTTACDANSPISLTLEQVTTFEDGERQFVACSAITGATVVGDDNTVLLLSSAEDPGESADREFHLFVADLTALATNGALVADNFQSGFGIACFDTDQPDLLQRQIETSLTIPDDVTLSLRQTKCRLEMDEANMRALR